MADQQTATAHDDDACKAVLVSTAAANPEPVAVDVHVGEQPPGWHAPHLRPAGFRCPHGVQYWVQPTRQQVDQWEREGVE